jgi:hypothetical protein
VAARDLQAGAVYKIEGISIFLDGEANIFQFEHWQRWVDLEGAVTRQNTDESHETCRNSWEMGSQKVG